MKTARVISVMTDICTASNGTAYVGVVAIYLPAPPALSNAPFVNSYNMQIKTTNKTKYAHQFKLNFQKDSIFY